MMNLETVVDNRLWESIRENYENKRYTAAILESIYFLNELIRDKTGLQSDGVALIGQAFGGKQPKLKVNSLQTESDWNVQVGLEQILRGIIQAVRNPRSHDKYDDNSKDAASIILFIDWLVGIIDRSKTQFSESGFIRLIFDANFVENEKYGELLAEQVPARKRLDVMIKIYRQKKEGDGKKLKYVVHALLKKMKEEEINDLYKVISDELKAIDDNDPIYKLMQAYPMEHWSRLEEIARMRAENMMIKSIKEGRYNRSQNKCLKGTLGTWVMGRGRYFTLKQEAAEVCINKLASSDNQEQDYVFEYLFQEIPHLIQEPSYTFQKAVLNGLKHGDIRFKNAIDLYCFAELDLEHWECENGSWTLPFKKALEDFKEVREENEFVPEDDDIPM